MSKHVEFLKRAICARKGNEFLDCPTIVGQAAVEKVDDYDTIIFASEGRMALVCTYDRVLTEENGFVSGKGPYTFCYLD